MGMLEMTNEPALRSEYILAGSKVFWRANLALLALAFSTYAVLNCVQPLMPTFSAAFRISPTMSSLSLSLPSAVIGVGIVVAGAVSELWGRKPIMGWSLLAAGIFTLGAAMAPSWGVFLLTRGFTGVALSGIPAVGMAYVSEEFQPRASGLAMGFYIGSGSLGGMAGRLAAGYLTDALSWRWAIGLIGAFTLCASGAFWALLPASRRFVAHEPVLSTLAATMAGHLRERGLCRLFLMGFLIMGAFVSVFDYVGFRLMGPPYRLSQAEVGLIFVVYLLGVASSAWAGAWAGRSGSRNVLWVMVAFLLGGVLLALAHPLWIVIAACAVTAFGFFGAHTVLSRWVGQRATGARALASSFYLLFYYAGGGILGTLTGVFWTRGGWYGVTALVSLTLGTALLLSLNLRGLPKVQVADPYRQSAV
jgi:MFS transporter, YNFM family, putative membrane transport protein